MIIYLVTNLVNGKIYIGKTTRTMDERKKEHKADARRGSDFHFHNALRKYGSESFDWQVIDYAETAEELNDKEKYWVQFYKSFDPALGYNETFGGDGVVPTEETRKKISESKKGKKWSSEQRKTRVIRTGWHHSVETRQKLSIFHKGKKHSEETKKKISNNNAMRTIKMQQYCRNRQLGKKHSEETKKKISNSHKLHINRITPAWNKGLIMSDEYRQKLSIAHIGHKHSEETKLKMSLAHRGRKYEST